MYVFCELKNGNTIQLQSKVFIGDYVELTDCGGQYSAYTDAFLYFWGDKKSYYIEYNLGDWKPLNVVPKYWKVINMAVNPDGRTLMYHIRSVDGKNCVVNGNAIELSSFHKRNRIPNGKVMVYQLRNNSADIVAHEWTDKLYEVIV